MLCRHKSAGNFMDLSPLNGTICCTIGCSVGGIGVSGRCESLSRLPPVSLHVGAAAFAGVKRKDFDLSPVDAIELCCERLIRAATAAPNHVSAMRRFIYAG